MSAVDAGSAAIPFKVGAEPSSNDLLLALFGFVLLLALAIGVLLWLRRSGRFGMLPSGDAGNRSVQIVGGKRLSVHTQAWLIDVDGQRTLVVESSRNIATRPLAGSSTDGQ